MRRKSMKAKQEKIQEPVKRTEIRSIYTMTKDEANREIASLIKILYGRTKLGEKVCLACYLKEIADLVNQL